MDRSRSLFSVFLAFVAAATAPPLLAQQVAEVQLAPRTLTLAVGERRELLATAFDARGDNVATASFVWVSSNPATVRVEADPSMPGIAAVVGLADGLANVEVRVGNKSASTVIQVSGGGGGAGSEGSGRDGEDGCTQGGGGGGGGRTDGSKFGGIGGDGLVIVYY